MWYTGQLILSLIPNSMYCTAGSLSQDTSVELESYC